MAGHEQNSAILKMSRNKGLSIMVFLGDHSMAMINHK